MRSSRGIVTALALLAGPLAATAQVATPEPPAAVRITDPALALRFGYVASDLATAREGRDASLRALDRYLGGVADRIHRSRTAGSPERHFEIALGTDYQVMSWLQEGELDAAVVPPFMARLLLEQEAAYPVVELRTGDGGAARWPEIWATLPPPPPTDREETAVEKNRRALGPLYQFAGYLQESEQDAAARADDFPPLPRGSYDLRFGSHLSTEGFLAPMACAARWIEARLAAHTWPRERRDRVERRFWTSVLEGARFTLGTETTVGPLAGANEVPIRFDAVSADGWEKRLYTPGASCGSATGFEPLDFRPFAIAAPPIPNDVVVVTPRLLRELDLPAPPFDPHWPEVCGDEPEGESAEEPRDDQLPAAPWNESILRVWLPQAPGDAAGFQRVHPLAVETWARFECELYQPFRRSALFREGEADWYDDGSYPFGLADLVLLLRSQQAGEQDPAAALVLPGGGVKSAYQARILDHLYAHHLTNEWRPARGTSSGDGRLAIRHVIGTSGGAIVGLLTAQSPGTCPTRLTSVWREVRSSWSLFPFLNLLRALSVLLLVWLLVLWLLLGSKRYGAGAGGGRSRWSFPWWLGALSLALVVAAPLLVGAAIDREELGDLGPAGLLFALQVALVHFGLHTVLHLAPRPAREGRHPLLSRARAWLAALLFLAALAATWWLASLPWAARLDRLPLVPEHGRASAVVALFLVLQAGLLLWAHRGRFGTRIARHRCRSYVAGMSIVGGHVVASYAAFGLFLWAGVAPVFELAGRFWIVLLLCGAASASLIVLWGRPHGHRPWNLGSGWLALRERAIAGVRFLVTRDRRVPRVPAPVVTAALLYSLALVWWIACLGHAFYANDRSGAFLERLARQRAAPDGTPGLRANLVVTGSALERSCGPDGRQNPSGDFYFCFPGPSGCPPVSNPRWHVGRTDDLAHVIDAVIASGSPVPVLPEHEVTLRDGCRVPLVDGGFAHNEPLEAALALGARQVLVVRSQPDPEALREAAPSPAAGRELRFPSRLAANLGGIFPFLFERSQELDRSVGRSLLVAYIAPHPEHGEFPLLTDFRRPVIERMIEAAEEDTTRLVGRVESWGRPEAVLTVRPP